MLACSSGEPAAEPTASSPPPAAQPAEEMPTPPAPGPRTMGDLSTPDAFDLVATVEGAALLWATPEPCADALHVVFLGPDGAPRGERRSLAGCPEPSLVDPARARITELAAASAAGRLGAAWIAEHPGASEVFGSHGDDNGGRWARASSMSPTVPRRVARGRLSMTSAESGGLRVSFRTSPAPCVAHGEGECAHYVARAHPSAQPARGVETREIPNPCPRMLAGSIWVGGVWYDGVCAGASDPVTHVFAIRPEISYAEVVESLSGCEPLGLSPTPHGAALWGRCPDGIGVRSLSPEGVHDQDLRQVDRSLGCRDGRPVLTAKAPDGSGFELALRAPLSRLESYLPATLAAPGSRAVWTGETLIIAEPRAGSLALSRHRCRGGALHGVDDV